MKKIFYLLLLFLFPACLWAQSEVIELRPDKAAATVRSAISQYR